MGETQRASGGRSVTGGFSAGARKSLPIIIGMVPSAMAFGILAKTAGPVSYTHLTLPTNSRV